MGRRTWLTLALATLLATSSVTGLAGASPKRFSDPRPKSVTRGLDYLHSHQETNGGFGSMADTAWGILGAVASGERMGASLWTSPAPILTGTSRPTTTSPPPPTMPMPPSTTPARSCPT